MNPLGIAGLQQLGEGCDGRSVQAPPRGASMFDFDLAWSYRLCFQTMSLGMLGFALSGNAAVGTKLGDALLAVFLRRSFHFSDIHVVSVS